MVDGPGERQADVESAAGHGQGKPATKQTEERSDVLAFLTSQLGM